MSEDTRLDRASTPYRWTQTISKFGSTCRNQERASSDGYVVLKATNSRHLGLPIMRVELASDQLTQI